jgi:hypothetical protein
VAASANAPRWIDTAPDRIAVTKFIIRSGPVLAGINHGLD